jgi:hypothetical protein
MQRTLAIATAIAAVILFSPQIASAQNSQQGQTRSSIRNQVKGRLEQDGFTHIRIMPEAFLVRAIDPDGNPVMMVVNANAFNSMMSSDQHNANPEEQEGQPTSRSARMTDDEANQSASNSAKMGSGPSQTIEGEKIPGRPNGMATELKQDETPPLTLTNSQRVAIWQMLGNQEAQANSTRSKPHVGQIVPNRLSLQPLPNSVSNQVPAVKSYDYTMLNNELLIVDPSTKKIVAIIAD